MPPTMLQGGAVVIKGLRFDHEKVVDAGQQVIDLLCERFCGGVAHLQALGVDQVHEVTWPHPGRQVFKDFWKNAAGLFDVIDQSLLIPMGTFTLKPCMLGKTWTVYFPHKDEVRTPGDEDLSNLDTVPMICIYGPYTGEDSFLLPEKKVIDAVVRVLDDKLGHLGLQVERSGVLPDPNEPSKLRFRRRKSCGRRRRKRAPDDIRD